MRERKRVREIERVGERQKSMSKYNVVTALQHKPNYHSLIIKKIESRSLIPYPDMPNLPRNFLASSLVKSGQTAKK